MRIELEHLHVPANGDTEIHVSQTTYVIYLRQYRDWMTGLRFPAGAGIISLRKTNQTVPGDHPASYQIGNGEFFLGDKAAGT